MERKINVATPERWLSAVTGAALTAYGLKRRSPAGAVLAVLGGALVWRGTTGRCPLYRSMRVTTARRRGDDHVSVPYGRGIRVEHSVTIDAPQDALFRFWRNLENLPRFLSHLESVRTIDSKRSHWIAKGPAGIDAEWDAEIINEVPDELIGWRSVEGSRVDNAGSVHFERANGGRGTRVRVLLRYDPPGGRAGAALAMLFGEDPERQIRDDLRTLEQLIETGEAVPHDRTS